ncbi:MAG: Structural maintenance of chromosomes protein 2 [Phylliscum demangeonii]|nr:MAG: Structural maintenance of chromosomes protein 2 [Phylliscum demangeonii]
MWVIEVIIDGFKSYAVRTVISGWDESFNSITGLNGSGKSNILDAICFVLGITNMSTVRAQNLQDLIYKRGQAGVTKASVTIVFDNNDASKSPIGFAEYGQISVTRQIVLGGTSKYLINGHRAQQHTVQNLFQSVQLNINNPNFLIMQGRITKVLNMKPVEILAMIEEAAGTRMFEDRRDKALKTMAKKEMKVREIGDLLRDEIEPKLDKLRAEKRAFLDFQQSQTHLARLTRLVVAYEYCRLQDRLRTAAADLERKRQRAAQLEASVAQRTTELAHLAEDVRRIQAQREAELRQGGHFQALEEEVKAQSHEIVRLATVLELKQTAVADDDGKRAALQASVAELQAHLAQTTAAARTRQQRYEGARAALERETEQAERQEELLQTLQTGVASREGHETGYQGQLQGGKSSSSFFSLLTTRRQPDAKQRASTAATAQAQARLKIEHLQTRIAAEAPRAQQAQAHNARQRHDLDAVRAHVARLEADLAQVGVPAGREAELAAAGAGHQDRIRQLSDEADGLTRSVAGLDFSYRDATPGVAPAAVKGLVAQLFTLDGAQRRAGTALEICAGARLYHVVVDSDRTATQLLLHGQLTKRITIIPLNKIAAWRASGAQVAAAQRLAPGAVELALSLIAYAPEVAPAMEYVFGATLVCDDGDAAQRVTFDPAVRLKSVTLHGDVYDPAGTLSGGSAPRAAGVLVTLQRLHEVTRELAAQQDALRELQATVVAETAKIEAARALRRELDLKRHELRLAEEQMEGNAASSIIHAIEEMKTTIVQLTADIDTAQARHAAASQDVARVERDMRDFDQNKDHKLAELQATVAAANASLSQQAASVATLQKDAQAVLLDAEQCGADLAAAQEQLHDSEVTRTAQQAEMDGLRQEQARVKAQRGETPGARTQDAHERAQAQLDTERATLTGFDAELRALEAATRATQARATDEGLARQQVGHQLDKSAKEQATLTTTLAGMTREHAWIEAEQALFGRAGSAYDFGAQPDMGAARTGLDAARAQCAGMRRAINPKVMNMIDAVEKKEAALKHMMRTVVRDKRKIEDTIANLDEYKRAALDRTWRQVNDHFGLIFADLLPGSFAKLDPPEGKPITEGLEVRVCLGQVWKQSLSELSGGQRSLIALSLILALLQFKPAPMYILDEVDAALDLSHTQNIGRLIQSRFKGSQFIVVSLKDGMFQNANRIFRTRFVDGTSVVQALTPADLR